MGMGSTKATVKGHGLAVDDMVNFHGMASDGFPSMEGTRCILGKDGTKYTLTSEEMSPAGTPWVWTFGAAAAFWASPVEVIHMDTEHGPTAHSAGCGVEVSDRYISRDRSKVTCGDCLSMPVSDDHDFESHSRRPWQCRICKRVRAQHVAPVEVPQVVIPTVEVPETPELDVFAEAMAEAELDELMEVAAMGKFSTPTNTPDIAGYYWKRYVIPGDSVTALSTYQLVQAGTTCQVAATVRYVKDGMWQATGCVWMSTGLTEGYWRGESLSDAFAHVAQYMTWVSSVLGVGLNWADINGLDWRTPYVAPEVEVAQVIREASDARIAKVKATEIVGPELPLTDWELELAPFVRTPEISQPVMTLLNKRKRRAGKAHAFAGKR